MFAFKALIVLMPLMFASGVLAQQSAVTIDELNMAITQCEAHVSFVGTGPIGSRQKIWDPGWEHCPDLYVAREKKVSAGSITPDFSKAIADKVKKQ